VAYRIGPIEGTLRAIAPLPGASAVCIQKGQPKEAPMTQATDIALLPEFVRFLETGEVAPSAFAPDVFLDMNVPSWRYQIQGHEAAAGLFHSEEPVRMHVGTVTSTATGFVVETDYETIEGGTRIYYRSVSLITIQDRRISNVVHYCTGPWDEATRVRQAHEAPMLRPDA
jgi:hypothetical protein